MALYKEVGVQTSDVGRTQPTGDACRINRLGGSRSDALPKPRSACPASIGEGLMAFTFSSVILGRRASTSAEAPAFYEEVGAPTNRCRLNVPRLSCPRAGQIVLADWSGNAVLKEPNKPRSVVLVEDDGLFAPNYPSEPAT